MKKKKLFIVILIILIIAVVLAFIIVKSTKKGTPIEQLMEDTTWVAKEENLIEEASHNWEVSESGTITCSHCNKSYEIGDTFDYKPEGKGEKIELSQELTGYTETQIVTRENATWVVFGVTDDGKGLEITTTEPLNEKDTIIFKGAQAYNNGIEALNTVCRVLYSNSEYGYARCMTMEDVCKYLDIDTEALTSQYISAEEIEEDNDKSDKRDVEDKTTKTTIATWVSTKNLTTKLKDIPEFQDIIKNGTYTPDGENTEEALGEYYADSYTLQSEDIVENGKSFVKMFGTDVEFEIEAKRNFFIFGVTGEYTYWLASRAVSLSNDFVAFGMSMINGFGASSCIEMYDSRNYTGLYYTDKLTPGIRPVVELYAID